MSENVTTDTDNIFVAILDALSPIIEEVLGFLPFPINVGVGFLWGGIKEAVSLLFE